MILGTVLKQKATLLEIWISMQVCQNWDPTKQITINTMKLIYLETFKGKCKANSIPCSSAGISWTAGGSRSFVGSPPLATLSLNSLRQV